MTSSKNLSANGRLKMWVKPNLAYLLIAFHKEACANDKGALDDSTTSLTANDVLVGLR
ncbi:Uncharacterised protein [Vibrio cholerae]|nr:Uncharacterised protein [Vibrio cholerae]